MEKIVPLISGDTTGPLGLVHLPRLWLKVLLHATGRLPEGYRHGSAGLDEMVCNAFGVDPEEFVAYVESELPTYVECERWFRERAKNLDPQAIELFNEGLRKRDKPEWQLRAQWKFTGIEDPAVRSTLLVNDLDDWACLHAQVTKGTIPPLIVSSLHSEFTELLKVLRLETDAARASIRVALPAQGVEPTTPMTENRRKGVASVLEYKIADFSASPAARYLERERRPLVQEDLSKDSSAAPEPEAIEKFGTRARLVGPVFAGDDLVASISIDETTGPRHWSHEDIAALQRAGAYAKKQIAAVIAGA